MNLELVKKAIAVACEKAGRDPNEIKLIAVSKGQSFSAILAAYQLGIRDFGENYAVELSIKQQLSYEHQLKDVRWHYLGAIQSNKINLIARADFIHSICQLRHAILINKIAQKKLGIFLQLNLNPDDNRQGFREKDLALAIDELKDLSMLNLLGLMMICPQGANKPAFWFERMQVLANNWALGLSMGMSADFSEAIAHGATYLRIGSKLFGPRGSYVA